MVTGSVGESDKESGGGDLPIRVGIVFAAFPAKNIVPYLYYLLLLNRLQKTIQIELFEIDTSDPFVSLLNVKPPHNEIFKKKKVQQANATQVRSELDAFSKRIRDQLTKSVKDFDVAKEQPDQIIIITGAVLSDLHYLVRRNSTSLLAVGLWERTMSPPSLAEFLQLLVLRTAYSAYSHKSTDGECIWNSIHLGIRACIFDFTANLDHARLMALTGVGVCGDCERALVADGLPSAPAEIKTIARNEWRGGRSMPGTPAHIMATMGYNLYATKGFEPTVMEQIGQLIISEGFKGFLNIIVAIIAALIAAILGLKSFL